MNKLSLVLFFAAISLNAAAQQSLDEVDRISFHAAKSPLEMEGEIMKTISNTATKARPPHSMSLSGNWLMVEDKGGSQPNWSAAITAKVPGSVHQSLQAAGKIPDPTVGRNDSIAERQSYKSWWMKRTFNYNGSWNNDVKLMFGGIANVCTVYLNGTKLGSHEGMFGGPDFIVTKLLKKGQNELLVHLDAIPDPGNTNPFLSSWTKTVVANCVYGWHYTKIPTIGIWQDVKLQEVPRHALVHPFIITRSTNGTMRLAVGLSNPIKQGKLKIVVEPKNFSGKKQAFAYNIADKDSSLYLDFNIANPQLWWPNDYGKQPLYKATISLETGGKTTDVKQVNFGIRTIEMRPIPEGERPNLYNWTFTVNGKPIFMKGGNWCLIDVMMDLSRNHYLKFLKAAKEQHFQLLRAWGGGLSETDTFYDLCDSLGIMVMQEWPTCWNSHNTQPYDIMEETVVRNTLRLRNHPSLALWAGGNESSEPQGKMIDMMGRASIELDGTRAFHRGEPCGGSGHNHDSWWLDQHLNNMLNMTTIFWGEFGMPSLPVEENVRRYLNGEEYTYPVKHGSIFEHHSPKFGTGEEMRRLDREASFFLSPTTLDRVVLGSQLAQIVGTRRTIERARSMWPKCTGAIYYKLNDVYPGLSWASVDYYGGRKPTHYFVKRSFEPVTSVILFSNTNLTCQKVSLPYYLLDDTLSLRGKTVKLHVSVYQFNLKCVYNDTITIKPTKSVERLPDIQLNQTQTYSPLLYFKTDLLDSDGKLIKRNWYIENFDSKKDAIFESPRSLVSVAQTDNKLSITNVSESVPAIFVKAEVPGEASTLDIDDNYLWIDPGETINLTLNTTSKAFISSWNGDVKYKKNEATKK